MNGSSRDRSSDKLSRLLADIEEAVDGTGMSALLLATDIGEGTMVREQLEALGYEVTVTRSRGSAMDLLTHRRFHLLFSEYEPWGDDGRQLFTPSIASGCDAPAEGVAVVFFGDAGDGYPERALRSGAKQALTRPLQPQEVVRATHSAIRAVAARRAEAAADGLQRPEPATIDALPETLVLDGNSAPAPALAAQGAAAAARDAHARADEARAGVEDHAASLPGKSFDPVPWWRFFFEVRIRLRPLSEPQQRIDAFLDCFRECVQPQASTLADLDRDGLRCSFGAASPTAPDSLDPAAARAWAKLLAQVFISEPREDTLRLPFHDGAGGRRLFLALLEPGSRPVPRPMVDELREVLSTLRRAAAAATSEKVPPRRGI